MDSNGILNISAKETATGKSKSITITNEKGRLSKDEISKMVQEAEANAEADAQLAATVGARNGLEQYCYNLRNTLNEAASSDEGGGGGGSLKEKLSEEDATAVTTAVDDTLSWLSGSTEEQAASKEEIDAKQKELEGIVNPIMAKLYQEQQQQQQQQQQPDPGVAAEGQGGTFETDPNTE